MPVIKRYFYVSLNKTYPKCYQVTLYKHFNLIELEREATETECFKHELRLIGVGALHDKHIQDNIKRYETNLSYKEGNNEK